MMRILLSFLLLSFISKSQTKLVKLTFEETRTYCGGAAPTQEILESLKQKKPFAYKMLYVYSKGKCIDSLKTDSSGIVNKKMKLGKYDLFLPWKHFKTAPVGTLSEYNLDCMKKEWLIADGILNVSAKNVEFTNKQIGHEICFYQYNCLLQRHLPPSAPPKQN
jgi:hypothetical protein